MFKVTPEQHAKRDATIYARVQATNKAFVRVQAKKNGFDSEASYVDAVLTKVRTSTKVAKKATKK